MLDMLTSRNMFANVLSRISLLLQSQIGNSINVKMYIFDNFFLFSFHSFFFPRHCEQKGKDKDKRGNQQFFSLSRRGGVIWLLFR